MKRIQFIELHESKWMPQFLRDALTDFLHVILVKYHVYEPAVQLLKSVINKTGVTQIIDLCSGGSGPLNQLLPLLEKETHKNIHIELTDIHPNLKAFADITEQSRGKISYITDSIDAKTVNESKSGIRTFFSSFHHFSKEDAKAILANAVTAKSPICIFEFTENKLDRVAKDIMVPFSVLLLMPKTRSFRLLRFLFTYIIPVLPLLVTFDSIVSNLRTYTPEELLAMAKEVNHIDYHWESAKVTSGFKFFKLTYLIGYPK